MIYSGTQFFDRKEIKDALSYLRMIAYKDDLSFARIANVPRRQLGVKRMRFLREYAAQNDCALYQALQRNLEHEALRGADARRFIALIEEFSASYAGRPVSEVLAALLNRSGYEEMLRTEGSQERLDNLPSSSSRSMSMRPPAARSARWRIIWRMSRCFPIRTRRRTKRRSSS